MVFLGPAFAYAGLSADPEHGEKTVDFPVPGRNAEVCVIPKHFYVGRYFDKDIEVENQLCNIDVHKNAAVCPKLNSTNPGLDFYSLPQGGTPKEVDAARCKTAGANKIAKYKLSSSCSYRRLSSAITMYRVCSAASLTFLRQFSARSICKITLPSVMRLWRRPRWAVFIHQTWASLMAELTAGASSKRRDFLFTNEFAQSYGALSEIQRMRASIRSSSTAVPTT